MKINKKVKKIGIVITSIIIIVLAVLIISLSFSNYLVERKATSFSYSNAQDVPYRKVALLLGTSKSVRNGYVNLFFKYRIDATVDLYKNHKLKYIIISGDHGEKYYNEPQDMKVALIAQGIPDSIIFLDYAGFRTLDSVVRCKEIFGQSQFVIISQPFHTERALYIAHEYNIDAIAFNAQEPSLKFGAQTYLREYFARVKLHLDILSNKKPKYMGEKMYLPD